MKLQSNKRNHSIYLPVYNKTSELQYNFTVRLQHKCIRNYSGTIIVIAILGLDYGSFKQGLRILCKVWFQCKTALAAVNSSGFGPLRQMFMSMSTVPTSSEFRYSDLSLPIQEKPLSQQDEDTATARQISITINTWERLQSSGCTCVNTSTQNSAWLKLVLCLWSQEYSFRDSHWPFARSKSKPLLLRTAWKCFYPLAKTFDYW